MKVTRKMPNPEGVSAGGTAVFRLPVGHVYHALYLDYAYNVTTQNVADFTEIRIIANGRTIQRFSGTQRDTINQFDGLAASVGVLEMPFNRRGLKIKQMEEISALVTGNPGPSGHIKSLYVEIDLDAGMTIGASDLELFALVSDVSQAQRGKGAGFIPFLLNEPRSAAGASTDFQISDLVNPGLNAPDKVSLNRVIFIPSTGTIDDIKVERNGYRIFDRPTEVNEAIQTYGGRSPQSGYYIVDTTEDGNGGELIELHNMNDFRYTLDVSAAMTITCLSEYFGVLNTPVTQ